MPSGRVKVAVVLARKHSALPTFVVVPAAKLAHLKLTTTTTVQASIDGVDLGRRSLKRWDDERWFVELRRDHLAALGKRDGDRATLVITLGSTDLPPQLQHLLDTVPAAHARFASLTDAQRRMLREDILAAKTPATRERRARAALLPAALPPKERVRGLSSTPRALVVRIVARNLPGRTCGPYREVSVGLVVKTVCDPAQMVSADEPQAIWETQIEVYEKGGNAAFRGPAVNGPAHERFLYLTWVGRDGHAAPAMFRRAKLRLDVIPADVLAKALHEGVLVGRLGLTASDGMPVCASVRPPAIVWSIGA